MPACGTQALQAVRASACALQSSVVSRLSPWTTFRPPRTTFRPPSLKRISARGTLATTLDITDIKPVQVVNMASAQELVLLPMHVLEQDDLSCLCCSFAQLASEFSSFCEQQKLLLLQAISNAPMQSTMSCVAGPILNISDERFLADLKQQCGNHWSCHSECVAPESATVHKVPIQVANTKCSRVDTAAAQLPHTWQKSTT